MKINFSGKDHIVALYVGLESINRLRSDEKKKLKDILKSGDIPYYWATSKYLEYDPGLYVFSEDSSLKIPFFSDNEIRVVKLHPLSYPVKFLLKSLIDYKVRKELEKVEKIGENKEGSIIYRFVNPLFSWPLKEWPIYKFYRRVYFRIEHIRQLGGYDASGNPIYIDELYLLPTMDLQVTTEVSLGNIVERTNNWDLLFLLINKRIIVREERKQEIGLLIDINRKKKTASIQLSKESVEVTLDKVYLQTNPTWYGNFLNNIGSLFNSSYDKLLDSFGLMTYRYEPTQGAQKKRKAFRNAPAIYLEHLERIAKEVFVNVFPISYLDVNYTISEHFIMLEEV
ncbi:MAG: hypothetical protein QXU81_09570 [Candidatus Bathyarchaeia archaeon]